ncbi:MAG TPA: hypothetical protein DDX51_06145 [Clostridiales bacterium]|nr:hypothetical protein [Clostridiales bacterium]
MKRKWSYILLLLLAGAGGAVLRGFSLLYGREPETGLPTAGYVPAAALIALTAVVIAAAFLLSRVWFGGVNDSSYEQMFEGAGVPERLLRVLAASGIVCGAGFALANLPYLLAEQTVNVNGELLYPGLLVAAALAAKWVLCLLSGVLLFIAAVRPNKPVTRLTGLCATVPMFWCCLDLILIYHENSGNPVLSAYSYVLILVIAVMASFYSIGSFLYAAKSPAVRYFAAVGAAWYLACTHIGGLAIWFACSGAETELLLAQTGLGGVLRAAAYGFAAVYLLVTLIGSLRRARL